MTKNKIVRYAANSALLAFLAAVGIGAYQVGTRTTEDGVQEDTSSLSSEEDYGTEELAEAEKTNTEISLEAESDPAGTDVVDASGTDFLSDTEDSQATVSDSLADDSDSSDGVFESSAAVTVTDSAQAEDSSVEAEETAGTAVSTSDAAPELSFSEDTLMEWPVHGNILLDYDMEQTTYFPTLDQYKLSSAIAVQAVEDAPVNASVEGTVYSIEENAETGTTVTMELGDGYQAIYGQLKDLTVEEGDTVEKGALIGYIAAPTKYYSKEGSNLYFAMKKDGEPVDPIAYLP